MTTRKATLGVRSLLSGHFLLDRLEPGELDSLLAFARVERHQANDVIFRKDDPGQSMMMVIDGRIKISSFGVDGKEVVLAILGRGEVLGEMAILEEKPRSADATALEASELVVLHKRDFIPFLERNPKVCIRLLQIMSDRLRRTSEIIEDRTFLSFPSRLAKALLDLAAAGGRKLPGGVRIEFKMSQKNLGEIWDTSKFLLDTGWATGDFNGDHVTDVSDFNVWNANRGFAIDMAAVPEPASVSLLIIGVIVTIMSRRNRVISL